MYFIIKIRNKGQKNPPPEELGLFGKGNGPNKRFVVSFACVAPTWRGVLVPRDTKNESDNTMIAGFALKILF